MMAIINKKHQFRPSVLTVSLVKNNRDLIPSRERTTDPHPKKNLTKQWTKSPLCCNRKLHLHYSLFHSWWIFQPAMFPFLLESRSFESSTFCPKKTAAVVSPECRVTSPLLMGSVHLGPGPDLGFRSKSLKCWVWKSTKVGAIMQHSLRWFKMIL